MKYKPTMTTKKCKKPPDYSFAFISLFPSAFSSRLASHSICILTGPSLAVLNWVLSYFRSVQIIGLFADDKLGQVAMVSSLQHATLTRSALGHCSWTFRTQGPTPVHKQPPSDSNQVGPNMNKSILLSNNNGSMQSLVHLCFVSRNDLNSSNGISKHGEPALEIILRPRLTKIRPK
ncbi:hypothetical protein Cgig2_007517 [Carnegiea gigantea]|uniref:Uncharacterized protein n=1 Tax=Carnegiea gigantea TaxID=171969 RepID=A0A9Q1JGI7_9CARY|nr:hypothetical protein Cgig2_007517 [Carnegiea gigantea]